MADNISPKIGKNVIETLTLGMYDDPRFIYREYIQNAADQIDIAVEQGILKNRSEGKIEITINSQLKSIIIKDNATGIESDFIFRFLWDVANSEKDSNKRKGFRGIGRLGGLGYCEKLIFETSYKGESVKNVMTLNANLLRKIINNRLDESDASSVISIITSVNTSPESSDSHYFRVVLENVTNNFVLDVLKVKDYLSMVAPVSFSPDFTFKDKIKKHFQDKYFQLDEYNVLVNEQSIYKAYSNFFIDKNYNKIAKLLNVVFFDVYDEEKYLLALGWYGISDGLNKVLHEKNVVRGIRIKKNNITIGDETTLIKTFPTERTNLRYIGEIHVVDNGFIPNARRDYFNDNETLKKFEKSLEFIFKDFEKELPHIVSKLHNRFNEVKEYKQIKKKFDLEKSTFRTEAENEQRTQELTSSHRLAHSASKTIEKIDTLSNDNPQIKDIFDNIVGEYNYSLRNEKLEANEEQVYPPYEFCKVNKDQAKILNEVANFLERELGYKNARPLIKKLQIIYN